MKCMILLLSLLPSIVLSAPTLNKKRADAPSDTDILQYALTLEHLENSFYSGALAKFDAGAFESAGFEPFVRNRFKQIAAHEATHVSFLQTALGSGATKPCAYNFPYTDPKSFAALSAVLEGVGVSAYLGAAQFITNKDYLTAAGSILTTESRHAAWVNAVADKSYPWNAAFDVPLSLNEVYSLAVGFIKTCPSTNPALPVKAFPTLTLSSTKPGSKSTLKFDSNSTSPLYLALFQSIVSTTFLPIDSKKTVTLPAAGKLEGTVYGVVTTASNGTVSDDNVIAGVAILQFDYPSTAP